MTKQEAFAIFKNAGGVTRLAKELNKTTQALYAWPDELGPDRTAMIKGVAFDLGLDVPGFKKKVTYSEER